MLLRNSWLSRLAAGAVISAALTIMIAAGGDAAGAAAADRLALWHIVHDRCVPAQRLHHTPSPCAYVSLARGEQNGYAILKDRKGATQFLLIPTRRMAGIESAVILAAGAPNYWQAAWAARGDVFRGIGHALPRDEVGMAINSSSGRGQDQLHIHIDCVQPAVRAWVGRHAAALRSNWSQRAVFEFEGRRYHAARIDSPDLAEIDPFRLLAGEAKADRHEMSMETLAVVGASFAGNRNGFVMFSDSAGAARGDRAHGEDLLDHKCSVARL